MTIRRVRLRFYVTIYTATAVLAVIGLAINIQTIPINENIQKLSMRAKVLRDENQQLKLKLLNTTRLEIVDQIATERLSMQPPDQIRYIQEKDKPNVFNHTAP
jgi:cell division protein FtsL